eukprot:symbB.v1.2.011886.t1/scaffold806.1/size231046/13
MNDVLRSVSVGHPGFKEWCQAVSPEEAMQRLMQAAGPGAGSPPPEVVGAALKATNVTPTAENVRRALEAAPTAAQVATAMQTASNGLPPDFFEVPGGVQAATAASASMPKPTTPEEVVEVLKKAGPSEDPPAAVVGTALRQAGLEITAENVLRALKAVKPGEEPSSKDLKIDGVSGIHGWFHPIFDEPCKHPRRWCVPYCKLLGRMRVNHHPKFWAQLYKLQACP